MEFNARQKKIIAANENKICCLAGAGTGKALPNSTVIPTPNGNKRVDEIKVGDYLFDRLGRPTKVLGVFPQGKKEVYKLYFSDGFTAKCCKEHLWSVKCGPFIDDYSEKTADEIMRDFSWTYFYIPSAAALQIEKENEDMTVDEAVDCLLNNTEEIDKLIYYSASFKEKVIEKLCEITNGRQHIADSNYVYYTLTFGEEQGLTDKTIKSIFYFLKSAGYSTQIFELKNCENYWFASFIAYSYSENCSIRITNIERLGYEEEMTCFYVDNSEHLFLTENFIVTHNTKVLTERARRHLTEGCDPQKIVCITFTNQAATEMKSRLGDIATGSFIGTIHSYANYICISNGFDTTDYILNEDFDKLFKIAINIPSSKYPEVDYLLIDEFQDICSHDYQFIEKIPFKNIFVVGDDRQAIYDFRGSGSQYLKSMVLDEDYTKYYLTQNYRCAPNIIDFADEKISSMEKLSMKCEAVKKKKGYINECGFGEALDDLEYSKDWGNWFILCRTNNEIDTALGLLEKREIPFVTFKRSELDLLEMETILRDNRVKVLTIHTAKGLESKHVIVTGVLTYKEEERRISYVAATRAEQSLYWCPSICPRWKKKRKAPVGNIETFKTKATPMVSFGE